MTSSIYLNEMGCLKIFEFHLENNSNSLTSCSSMIFMREDKMTSSNYMKYELGVQRIKFKVLLNLFSIWSYLSFIQIIFSPKIKYTEIRVT